MQGAEQEVLSLHQVRIPLERASGTTGGRGESAGDPVVWAGPRTLHCLWPPTPPEALGGRSRPLSSSQGPWSSWWGQALWVRCAGFESQLLR